MRTCFIKKTHLRIDRFSRTFFPSNSCRLSLSASKAVQCEFTLQPNEKKTNNNSAHSNHLRNCLYRTDILWLKIMNDYPPLSVERTQFQLISELLIKMMTQFFNLLISKSSIYSFLSPLPDKTK